MSVLEFHTDGNEIAGLLHEIFASEMTSTLRTCETCGQRRAIGSHRPVRSARPAARRPAGRDVPITSDPREEEELGVPAPAPGGENGGRDGGGGGEARGGGAGVAGGRLTGGGADTEEREVRSEDPELSPETNQRLTAELRDVVGD